MLFSLSRSKPRVVIIGDSITMLAADADTCGPNTFNGGVPGYKSSDYEWLLPSVMRLSGTAKFVLALGTNEAISKANLIDTFGPSYARILDRLKGRVEAVVELPPGPDERRRAEADHIIASLAHQRGLPVIPVNAMQTDASGIHPTQAGAAMWRSAILRGCLRVERI